ncbi:MAG TPA: Plug domain-containing protein [Saprospiraceae bacterium]|nr:Plug domain-containing protein [Saprospiraceae bacterium]
MQSMVKNLGILLLCLPLRGWAQSGDPLQLVQAKLPGLLSTRAGNDPNGVFDSQIRGLTTFGNPTPFYLVDGMPVEDLSGIHPADIERVELVAAGTSLWSGMRAGNGILQIHTRQGQEGKLQLRYRQMRASERMTRDPGMMSAIEFRRAGGSLAVDPDTETNWWIGIFVIRLPTRHLMLSPIPEPL